MLTTKVTRRDLLRTSALGGLGLALAACAPATAPAGAPPAEGEQAEAEQPAEEAAPSEEVTTVRFMSRAGAANIPTYQEVLDTDFRAEHPEIQVAIEPAPDGWEDKLLAQMVAGTAVDIFQAWGNIFFNWTERDLLLDVQPYVDATMTAEEIADYNDFQWEGLVMRGIRVGMPKYINLMTVTINKDLFDKYGVEYPPEDGEWDHDDYADMAKRLTEAAQAAGDNNTWGGWYPAWSWDRFWYRVDMFGGSVVDEKYGTKCMLGSEESQAALQWTYDMIHTNNWFAQPAQVENKWARDTMPSNLICMAEDGTYPGNDTRNFGESFRWSYYHVPKGPTGLRKVLGTTDAWSITKQTKVPDEAWAVLKFLSGPIFQRKAVMEQEGIIPVLKSLIDTFIDRIREKYPILVDVRLETIKEILEWGYAEDTFWFKNQNAAAELIQPALEKVFTVGDVGPEYFIEICEQVDASQLA
jgi:ABC-type glycerol-3-phosphate transport system substrate-binding protein